MKTNPKDIPPEAIPISKAWLHFADYPEDFGDRRKRFSEILRNNASRTDIDENARLHPVNIQTDKLQCELLSQIRDGAFDVWGRDGSKGINSPHILLPNNYFDELRDFFRADWKRDIVEIHQEKFLDVRVAPSSMSSTETGPHSKKIGRPSGDGIEEAIEKLDAGNSEFANLGRKIQCEQVREEILGPKVNHDNPPKNYGDGAIKNRLRAYFGVIKS